jgi:hypothetical protein
MKMTPTGFFTGLQVNVLQDDVACHEEAKACDDGGGDPGEPFV